MTCNSSCSGTGRQHVLFVRTTQNKTRAFTLQKDTLIGEDILQLVYGTVTEHHRHHLYVTDGSKVLYGDTEIRARPDGLFNTCHIIGRLRGGKGGFGSLLRGSGAAQKKTTNFDACRDMSGRRMRHVNAEKKLKEWRQEAGERKLEKVAQDYIKKLARDQKQEAEAAKVVTNIKEISHETMDRVAESVKLGMQKSKLSDLEKKRKRDAPGGEDRKGKAELRDWSHVAPGLALLEEEDEEDEEEEDSEEEDEEEEGEGKDASIEGAGGAGSSRGAHGAGSSAPASKPGQDSEINGLSSTKRLRSDKPAEALPELVQNGQEATTNGSASSPSSSSPSDHKSGGASPEPPSTETQGATLKSSEKKIPQLAKADAKTPPPDGPLDWTKIASAADLEAYGLDWLKAELTKNGLKCGGTVQERAARLFLLKDTPISKVDKKHLARPPQKKA